MALSSPETPHHYFERLATYHNRKAFNCGEPSLNGYLQRYAKQNTERYLGITHVVVAEPQHSTILGYYTLLSRDIERELFPRSKTLSPDGVGVVLLGRLAVDQGAQGQGIGTAMLLRAMRQTEAAAQNIGINALIVHALNEPAREWYVKFGFKTLLDDPNHLYLSVDTIRALGMGFA